jgi:hypothetical protein
MLNRPQRDPENLPDIRLWIHTSRLRLKYGGHSTLETAGSQFIPADQWWVNLRRRVLVGRVNITWPTTIGSCRLSLSALRRIDQGSILFWVPQSSGSKSASPFNSSRQPNRPTLNPTNPRSSPTDRQSSPPPAPPTTPKHPPPAPHSAPTPTTVSPPPESSVPPVPPAIVLGLPAAALITHRKNLKHYLWGNIRLLPLQVRLPHPPRSANHRRRS